MSEPFAHLIIQVGSAPEQVFDMTQLIVTLGRDPLNSVVIADPEVSRRHAQMEYSVEDKEAIIEDLGSTNGTFVNGHRVTVPTVVRHGDTIAFGQSVSLVFRLSLPRLQEAPTQVMGRGADDDTGGTMIELPEEVGDDSADYYVPPPDRVRVASTPLPMDQPQSGGCRRFAVGCGCVILILFILLGTTLFFLDSFAPDLLYCGPLRGFWETFLEPILGLAGKTLACP